MSHMSDKEKLDIKKYPNRRLYDATRSQHITLYEIHDLILEGHDVQVTETSSGADITNLVLMQIVVERQQLKLDLFPAAVLHMLIRSQPQAFQATIEQYFGPFMNVFAQSQKQFDEHIRKTFGTTMTTPIQWANTMMQAFQPNQSARSTPAKRDINETTHTETPTESPSSKDTNDASIEELRLQAAALLERIDNLSVSKQTSTEDS